jgi:hypothetical protein
MRLCTVLLIGCATYAQVNVPDIVKRSSDNTGRNWKEAPKYVFTERDVEEKLDSSGDVKTRKVRTWEVMVLEGSNYNKLIAINDKPLSPEEQRAENEKLAHERYRRQHESEADRRKRIAKYQHERQQDHVMMGEMARAFDYKLVGQETVQGRACWVLDATPKRSYVPINRDARVLTGMKGELWIDKQDIQWVKVSAEVVRPVSFYAVATVGPGTRFELEQKPVGDGIWLPSHFAVRVNSTILAFIAHNSLDDETYSNYRRSGTQVALDSGKSSGSATNK